MSLTHTTIPTNGLSLHVVQAGPTDGPLVILLHGFPEFWYGWRAQIGALAEAGFRVWVPDQRGYNLSDKPRGVRAYHRDALALDVVGLIEAAGVEKARVVGHDWGAAVAWWLANRHPERVERLAILNVPHHRVMERALTHSLRQLLRSWYIFFFQLPRLPEVLLARQNYAALARSMRGSSRPGTFSAAEMAQYRAAWSQPGALTAMLNYYRAVTRSRSPADARIRVPTRLLWGAKDRFFGVELATASLDWCDEGELVLLPDASHWLQHEAPERINALLLDFLG